MTARVAGVARSAWPPVVFGAIMLGLWQFIVRFFDLKPYFLVAPTDIYRALIDNWSNIWEAMRVSGTTGRGLGIELNERALARFLVESAGGG